MAGNNGVDALGALLGLGVLGSMLDGSNSDMIKKMNMSGKSTIPTPGQKLKKATPAEDANAAKEIYDSYVAAGFNEIQAFELLKVALTVHKTIF